MMKQFHRKDPIKKEISDLLLLSETELQCSIGGTDLDLILQISQILSVRIDPCALVIDFDPDLPVILNDSRIGIAVMGTDRRDPDDLRFRIQPRSSRRQVVGGRSRRGTDDARSLRLPLRSSDLRSFRTDPWIR